MIVATVDTNVLVSGVLFAGAPRQVLWEAIEGAYELAVSEPILEEFSSVLRRSKFALDQEFVHHIVHELEVVAVVTYPRVQHEVVDRDPDDNKIVDCAVEARAGFIVTGDEDLLTLKTLHGIAIVTPNAFLDHLRSLKQ